MSTQRAWTNPKDQPAAPSEQFITFLAELLAERRGSGGWVRVRELAQAAKVSRATAYRYLDAIEAAGIPVEHDDENMRRPGAWRGVRSLLCLTRRPARQPSNPAKESTP